MEGEWRICKISGEKFFITSSDFEFYKKINVTPPTLCPRERLRRRMACRNEAYLYKRKCDLSNNIFISFFPEDTPFPVYTQSEWWSDKWDPLDYGRDFDFSKTFFDQFYDLLMDVPKSGMLHLNNENSEYNTLLAYSKNTYMSPGSYLMEDCYYVRKSQNCKDCISSMAIDKCELVSMGINSSGCYNCNMIVNCRNCSNCRFLADSISCKDCFLSAGLKNKKYCFKNRELTKEEYERVTEEYDRKDFMEILKEFKEFYSTIPKRYQNKINCENSSGDFIQNCKNAIECYDSFDIEDSKYIYESVDVKDSMDLFCHDKNIELCYEVSSGGESNKNLLFSYCTISSPNSYYLYSCFYLHDSFGCDGFHGRNSHCILNKKYSPADYENMKNKIIDHMKETGEWGEFFPIEKSLHAYNESIAQFFMPLTRNEAIARGYRWKDDLVINRSGVSVDYKIPHNIDDVEINICDKILKCDLSGNSYKIIPQEFDLYKKMRIQIPRISSEERQKILMGFRNPMQLIKKQCAKCGSEVETTSPSNNVYCEDCYLNNILS